MVDIRPSLYLYILSIYYTDKSDSGGSPTASESSSLSTVSGIIPSAASSGSPDVSSSTTELSTKDLNTFTVLEKSDKFSTLKTALDAAGITQETIDGLKPITIFAPTNYAFFQLPFGLLDDLLKPENKENLTNILKNHIIKNQKIDLPEGMLTFVEN